MPKTFTQKAQEIVEQLGDNYQIYEGYSGRFMFGRTCLGITGPDPTKIRGKAYKRGFGRGKIDNMGVDYIVYWPQIKG
jgi:hypothetical protein